MILSSPTRLIANTVLWVNVKPLTTAVWMPLSSELYTPWIVVWFIFNLPSLLMRMSGRTESKAYRSLERLHLLHPFYLQGLSIYHRRKLNWSGMICSSKSHVGCYPVCYTLLGDCKLIILMIYLSDACGTVFGWPFFLSSFKDGNCFIFFSSLGIFLDTFSFFLS